MNTSGGILGRFSIELNTLEGSSLWVGAGDAPQNRLANNTAVLSKEYRVADALSSGNTDSGNKDNVTVRAILVLEPAFTGAAPGGAFGPVPRAPATFTFVGWKTDGTALPSSEPRTRRIELVGDSIVRHRRFPSPRVGGAILPAVRVLSSRCYICIMLPGELCS